MTRPLLDILSAPAASEAEPSEAIDLVLAPGPRQDYRTITWTDRDGTVHTDRLPPHPDDPEAG